MRLSIDEVESMPPAFKELEDITKELQDARFKFNNHLLSAGREKESPHAGSFEKITELQTKLRKSFALTLKKELSANHFEIFEAIGFLPFVETSGLKSFIGESLGNSEVFSSLLNAAKRNPWTIMDFMLRVGEFLSTEQIDETWEAVKLCLRRHDVPWLAEVGIKSEEPFFDEKLTLVREPQYVHSLAKPYMESSSISLETLSEASFLTLPLGLVDQDTKDPIFRGGRLHDLGLDALALAVFNFNRPGFDEYQKANQIDPMVVDTLISSWRGDLRSFLIAAKSLSADCDPAD